MLNVNPSCSTGSRCSFMHLAGKKKGRFVATEEILRAMLFSRGKNFKLVWGLKLKAHGSLGKIKVHKRHWFWSERRGPSLERVFQSDGKYDYIIRPLG